MLQTSAGILLYRLVNKLPEFFLVHPGGPFFQRKQAEYWTIPKGEPDEGESLIDCAIREFDEEIGMRPTGTLTGLRPVRQKAGKLVHAWLLEGEVDAATIRSNYFSIIWPPGSTTVKHFPEIDKAAWFTPKQAIEMINTAQRSFIIEACELLNAPLTSP